MRFFPRGYSTASLTEQVYLSTRYIRATVRHDASVECIFWSPNFLQDLRIPETRLLSGGQLTFYYITIEPKQHIPMQSLVGYDLLSYW